MVAMQDSKLSPAVRRPVRPSPKLAQRPKPIAARSNARPRLSPAKPAASNPTEQPPNAVTLERYIAARGEASLALAEPHSPGLDEAVREIGAVAAFETSMVPTGETLATVRGYAHEDLMAVAEVGYHYLMSGGLRLALILFEGLEAVSPDEPYFVLALGLTHDRLEDPIGAERWYRRAAELDPSDPRPDVNLAELLLERGERSAARERLGAALEKARARGEVELERKSRALLDHMSPRPCAAR
ncbi:MAG: hypothetical protein HYV07_27825 [Deltaproteobacteria bacterium]|nr:hypothetical protein [Deltaproteobacteria bacterium]